MKKIILLLVIVLSLSASEVNWFHSFSKASEAAKESNKPMMLFMNREDCGSCAYMKESVFTDEKVISYLNENFISVALDVNENDAPDKFQVRATPVFHYLKYDGTKIIDTLVGGKTAPFFLKLLKKADEAAK